MEVIVVLALGIMVGEEIIKAMQEYAELYYLAKTKNETFKSE